MKSSIKSNIHSYLSPRNKETPKYLHNNLLCIDNIAYPTSTNFNYKELGYYELIQTEKKQVKRLFNMFYKSNDFRRAKAKFVEKDNTNEEVKKYLYAITTAPPPPVDYSF